MKIKGIAFTILSALLFGFTPVLASMSYEEGSNPLTLTFYRNFLVIPIVAIVMLVRKTSFKITKKELIDLFVVGCLGRGVTTLTLYSSYDYIGIGTSTTLHFLYPVFVALICRIFYKDRLDRQKIIALIIAAGGVMFFLEKGNLAEGWPGLLLAAGSGLTYAFYMVGLEKKHLSEMDPFKVSFYMAISVSIGMLLYNFPTRQIVFALPPKAFLLTLTVAVCTSLLAVIFLQIGIKYLNATVAAIFCLFEPIACSISGVLFLSEEMSWMKIIGSVLILAAVLIIMMPTKKPPARKQLQNPIESR